MRNNLLAFVFPSGEYYPIKILESWELTSMAKAKRGVKASLQDLISQIKEFPHDLRQSIDSDLAVNELPSLRELQGVISKTIDKVIKRGQIKTLNEFYIIKEEVIDLTSDLTDDIRTNLDKMLAEFELLKRK